MSLGYQINRILLQIGLSNQIQDFPIFGFQIHYLGAPENNSNIIQQSKHLQQPNL